MNTSIALPPSVWVKSERLLDECQNATWSEIEAQYSPARAVCGIGGRPFVRFIYQALCALTG